MTTNNLITKGLGGNTLIIKGFNGDGYIVLIISKINTTITRNTAIKTMLHLSLDRKVISTTTPERTITLA